MSDPNARMHVQTSGELSISIAPSEEYVVIRMQEYTALLDYTARLSDRRQAVNNYFSGINTIFLTAFGYLLVTMPLKPWWPVFIFPVLALATILINTGWLQLIRRYRNLLNIRFKYLEELENYFARAGQKTVGVIIEGEKKGDDKNVTVVPPDKKHPKPRIQVETLGVHNLESFSPLFAQKISFSSIEARIVYFFFAAYGGISLFAIAITIANAAGANLPPIIK